MSREVTFEVGSTLKEDPKKTPSIFKRFKKWLFEPEGMGDRRLIEFELAGSLPEVTDDEDSPEDSIVLVRDMKKIVDDLEHRDLFNRFLIEVRRWDKRLRSYELDHYGFRDLKIEDVKSLSQIAMLASIAGFKGVYEVPACYGTSTFKSGVVDEGFLKRNGFKKIV